MMPDDLTNVFISVGGMPARKVLKWHAQWSLVPHKYPHIIWLCFAGDAGKFTRYTSEGSSFPGLTIVE